MVRLAATSHLMLLRFFYIFQLLLAVILLNKSHFCQGGVVAGGFTRNMATI